MATSITLTSRKPSPPPADFMFTIDFRRGQGSPSRVFSATHEFINLCESLDRALVRCIDTNIQPVMVLEDVEAQSLKTFLRSVLTTTDDQALRHLDWKPLVGKFLVDAKYCILRWIDEGDSRKSIADISQEVEKMADAADVLHLPHYEPLGYTALLDAATSSQNVKDLLAEGDVAYMEKTDGSRHDMNLSVRWDADAIEEFATARTEIASAPMVLIVKKPDYLGESQWELRHGKSAIFAKIEDAEWLSGFQRRTVSLLPGDALRCIVRIENAYGIDNELIATHYYVVSVTEVIPGYRRPPSMFRDDK